MNEFSRKHESYIRAMYRHGVWPMYATVEKCLELIDEPTFQHGITLFRDITGLPGDEKDVAPDNPAFFCGHTTFEAFTRQGRWPEMRVTWHTIGGIGDITPDEFKSSTHIGCSWWAEGSPIRPEYTPNNKTANILVRGVRIDGFGGILADMQLVPPGLRSNAGVQLNGRFDLERLTANPAGEQGKLSLPAIDAHEFGHAWGLLHQRDGLMRPTYDTAVLRPIEADYRAMAGVYGSVQPTPVPSPVPIPTPVPPDTKRVWFDVGSDGSIKAASVPGFVLMRG